MILKQGDLTPDLTIDCTSNGVAPDFTAATSVQVVCRREGGASPLFTRSANGSAQGVVTYAWQAGDTDTPGRLLFEVVATWPGSEPQRFPSVSYLPVDIEASLG